MAKRLNKNVVVGLTSVAFVVMTAAGVLMVSSLRQADPRELAAKAETFAKSGEHARARTHFMRAFQVADPPDPIYLVKAGDMALLTGNEIEALSLWQQAVTLNPDLIEAQTKILDYYVPSEMWLKAKETAEAVLRSEDKNPKALHALGLALIRLADQPEGDRKRGLECLEQARQLAPEVFEYSATAIRMNWTEAAQLVTTDPAASKERMNAALDLARAITAKNPGPSKDAAAARSLYASRLSADLGTQYGPVLEPVIQKHLEGKDRFAEAERLYQEAIQVSGTEPEAVSDAMTSFAAYWFDRAQIAVRREGKPEAGKADFAKASDWGRKAIDAHKTGFVSYQLLAQVHANGSEFVKAGEVCEERLVLPIERKGLKAREAKLNRIGLLLFAGEQYVAAASSAERGSPEFDQTLKKAEHHVEDALAEFADPDRAGYALHVMGKVKVVAGKDKEAVALFEKADKAANTPSWQNKRWLGILQARLGQYGAAREALLEAVRDPRVDFTTWVTLAKVYVHFDDIHAAERAVEEALRLSPGQSEALSLKAIVLQKQGRASEAEALMGTQTETTEPRPVMRARILASEGKFEEAFALVSDVLAKKPTLEPALRDMVQYAEKLGKQAEARALLQKAAQQEPDKLSIKFLMLSVEEGLSEEEKSKKLLDLIQQIPDEYIRTARLANLYRGDNKPAEALEYFHKAADLILKASTPEAKQAGPAGLNGALQGWLFAALDLKKWDEAEAAIKIAVKENVDGAKGNTFKGKYHLARGTAADPKSKDAQEEWNKAAEAFKLALTEQPTDSDALTWLGECHFRSDRASEAKTCFTRAADINPSNFRAQIRLAEMAEKEGQTEEFNTRLDQCQKLAPNDPWVKAKELARQEERNPKEGIARRETMHQENPADMGNIMQLARLYAADGQAEKAEEFYGKALADPQAFHSTVWPAAQFHLRSGNPAKGLKILNDAVDTAETPEQKATFLLMTGTVYRMLENMAESDRQFRNAVDLSPSPTTFLGFADQYLVTDRPKEALPWLDKAIEAADKAATPQADPAQIRRIRIETLLSKLNDREAARKAVQEYASLYAKDPNVDFLNSEIEFAFGESEKAIAGLNRYLEHFPNHPTALYRRAQLYGNVWKWPAAIKDLESLKASSPEALGFTPRMLLALAYDLVDRADLSQTELKLLYEQYPDNDRICREYVNYFLKHERYTDAISLATALVNRQPTNPIWYRYLGQAALKMDDGAKTLESFTKAVELSSNDWRYISALLEAFQAFKNYDAGVRFYLETLPPDKRVPPLICRYANLLAGAGKQQEAIAAYREAISTPAAYSDELFVQEVAANATQAFGETAVLDLFRVEPGDERLMRPNQHLLASMLYHFKHTAEAVAALDALLATAESDDERAGILVRRGVIQELEDKNYEAARQSYEKAVEYNPKNVVVLNNLAYLLSDKLNKPADALPYAERAAALAGQAPVIDTLGWVRVQLGQYGQGIGDLSRALMSDPEFVPAHYHRAEAYRRSERHDEAIQGYEAALKLIAKTTNPEYLAFKEPCEAGLKKAADRDKSP